MKRILIIGATSAIAERCARIWAAKGDALHLVARSEQHVQTIAADLKVRGASEVTTYCTDLNDMDKHEELLNVADDALGRVLLQRFGPAKPCWTCVSVKLPVQRIGETGRVRA